jgi:drug/metabolite transporter (DMT)-like permease
MQPATLGVLCALLSAIGFSLKAILVKQAYRYGVDPETLLALRMLYSLPFFIAMALLAHWRDPRRLTPRDWFALLELGFFGYYLSSYLDFSGLQYISAGLERVVLYTYPLLVVLLTAVSARRAPEGRVFAALAVCYAGVAFAVWNDSQVGQRNLPLGTLLVMCSAVTFAFYLWRAAPVLQRLGAARVTAWATGFACLMVLLQFVLLRPLPTLWSQPWPVQANGVGMALFSTVVPIWLTGHAIRLLGPSRAAITSTLGPVLTLFMAWAFLGESLSWQVVAGALMVVAGVRWVTQARRA